MGKKKREYYKILEEFNIEKYNAMADCSHHGLSRYEHSLRVAKSSFYVSKMLKADTLSVTRAALMHDFFTNDDIDKSQWGKYLKAHPSIALINAKKYFEVNELEEEIIKSHMYPFGEYKPNSKEAWIVTISDKLASIYEFLRYEILRGNILK